MAHEEDICLCRIGKPKEAVVKYKGLKRILRKVVGFCLLAAGVVLFLAEPGFAGVLFMAAGVILSI